MATDKTPSLNVEGCEFCAIVRGESDAELLFEESDWIAFFPLNPATPGHTLVIPRAHVPDLWQASPGLASELMRAVLKVGHAIQRGLGPDGLNLITSAGTTAEQTVFHLHLHVVPRWRHDHFGPIWPTGEPFEDEALADAAERIRRAGETSD
jgi:histidine triad (HIT) family protein